MSDFRPHVERWRALVSSVAPDIHPDLVLAVIEFESGGNPRAVSSSKAAGLMQTKKIVFDTYAASAEGRRNPLSWATITSDSADAPRQQVALGTWLLRSHLERARTLRPDASGPTTAPTSWQMHAADLMYSHGRAGFEKLRKGALNANFADDIDGWEAYQREHAPGWTSERPFFHARGVAHIAASKGGTRQSENKRQGGKPQGKPPRTHPADEPRGGPREELLLLALGALLAYLASLDRSREVPLA